MLIVKTMLMVAAAAGFLIFLSNSQAAFSASAAGSSASGPADIYAAHCAVCHGRDGRAKTARGQRAGATDLTSDWNRDEARGIRIITNGRKEMPSFKKKLTAAEIRSVFGYVSRF